VSPKSDEGFAAHVKASGDVLARMDLFSGLDTDAMARLADELVPLAVSAGGVLLRQGDAANALYLIVQGTFSVLVAPEENDQEPVLVRTMGVGEYFGEMGLLTDNPHSATIRAEGDSQVLTLPRAAFHQLLRDHPATALPVLVTVSRRLQAISTEMAAAKRSSRELLQMNQDLEASQEKLRELSTIKSEFVSHVSHELRTPLAAMRMAIDNVLDGVVGAPDPRLRRYLVRLKENADRLNRLIANLLDLSRLEAGRIELHCSAVKVADAVSRVVDTIGPLAAAKGLTVAVDTALPTQCAWADPDKVDQILTNLLGNAVKFTPAAGRIGVSACVRTGRETQLAGGGADQAGASADSWLEIAVQDTGEGVPVSEQQAIFDKFYQVHRGGPKRPGAGLGLAIAKTLVELHGGRLWVESKPGCGSRFAFTLPLVAG
jgi:signal transduction histidine kinase